MPRLVVKTALPSRAATTASRPWRSRPSSSRLNACAAVSSGWDAMETEILMLSAEYRSQHREKTGKRISNAAGEEQISLYSRRMKEYGRNVREVNGKIYKNYRLIWMRFGYAGEALGVGLSTAE